MKQSQLFNIGKFEFQTHQNFIMHDNYTQRATGQQWLHNATIMTLMSKFCLSQIICNVITK